MFVLAPGIVILCQLEPHFKVESSLSFCLACCPSAVTKHLGKETSQELRRFREPDAIEQVERVSAEQLGGGPTRSGEGFPHIQVFLPQVISLSLKVVFRVLFPLDNKFPVKNL